MGELPMVLMFLWTF